MRAYLVLEDGSVYEGEARAAFRETVCKFLVSTAMSGYVETLSDPSSAGLGIIMSYPMAGNYGVCRADMQSERLWASALVVNELCETPSNFRSEGKLEDLLQEFSVPCLCDLDTRALMKKLRDTGAMYGMLTEDVSDMARCSEAIASCRLERLVEAVSTKEVLDYAAEQTGLSIALLDLGVKNALPAALQQRGASVTRYPWNTAAETILAGGHQGILVAGGPGEPAEYDDIAAQIKALHASGLPLLALDLGHLLLAHALGGEIEAMRHAHAGGNLPVKFLEQDRTYLTAQGHAYVVKRDALPQGAQLLCVNVNDQTVEGLRYGETALSVQFHPEAAPGPEDCLFLLDDFVAQCRAK